MSPSPSMSAAVIPRGLPGAAMSDRVKPPRPDMVAKAIAPDYALGPHTASLGLAWSYIYRQPLTVGDGIIGQVVQKRWDVPSVVVRVLDPARAEFYSARGLRTICPTQTAIAGLTEAVAARGVPDETISLTGLVGYAPFIAVCAEPSGASENRIAHRIVMDTGFSCISISSLVSRF